ncbi:TraR/DksA C4-type zinc finger protein [Sphingomonas sp.]|uniref:TraR/DksA family transcriptional regulator n=1 Tax=Sphingomonas sp. TaxID=28214 RepID=UPI00307E3724
MAIDPAIFRQRLLDRRVELEREEELSQEARAPVTLEQDSVGRLSRMDAMQVQAMALAQQRCRKNEQAAIVAALRRIDEGEYGYCLVCGEEIAEARLLNWPAVTTCIGCAAGK